MSRLQCFWQSCGLKHCSSDHTINCWRDTRLQTVQSWNAGSSCGQDGRSIYRDLAMDGIDTGLMALMLV
jgi:hypothetical protein